MLVKICGITRPEDAHAAVRAGADAIGFVFVRSSPRYLAADHAAEIIATLPEHVLPVGVFVNSSPGEIAGIVERSGIRCVQLHGDEPPGFVHELPVRVWKAFRISGEHSLPSMASWQVDAFLLDSWDLAGRGGTGKVFDWRIAVRVAGEGRVILAGGLRPENVAEAVSIVQPYGVDVSSGVETSPGKKDAVKIQEFVAAARAPSRGLAGNLERRK